MIGARTADALSKAGALVRTIARRSMRYVTGLREQQRQVAAGQRNRLTGDAAPSAPGQPPHAVRPHPWIREFLYYAYDPAAGSVVIGPVRLSSRVNVPAVHEFGRCRLFATRRVIGCQVANLGENVLAACSHAASFALALQLKCN